MKKISIVIPTYNSALTIKKTLKSIFDQTYKNFEVIIVDSYSTDGTKKIIKSFKKKKIKVFNVSKKKKLSYARYYGIKKATGSLIAFLDSDDYWDKKKLSIQSKQIKGYRFCSTGFSLVKDNNKMFFNDYPKFLDLNSLIYERPIANSSVLVEKDLIYKIAKKFQNVDYAEDYLWWIIVMKRIKKTLFIKKNLTFIRVMNKSRTYKNIFKNLNSLNYIYKNILKLNYLQIFVIYILLIIKNLKKKYFFYFK